MLRGPWHWLIQKLFGYGFFFLSLAISLLIQCCCWGCFHSTTFGLCGLGWVFGLGVGLGCALWWLWLWRAVFDVKMLLLALGCSSFFDPGCSSCFTLSQRTHSPQGNSGIFFLLWFLSLVRSCCCCCRCTTSAVHCVLGWFFGLVCFLGLEKLLL
jgi:hypothetical protein